MKRDWLHCNSLDYNAELDQIVINSVQGESYIIDHGGTFIAGDPDAQLVALLRSQAPLRRVVAAIAGRLVTTRAWERLGYARSADHAAERAGCSARQLQELASPRFSPRLQRGRLAARGRRRGRRGSFRERGCGRCARGARKLDCRAGVITACCTAAKNCILRALFPGPPGTGEISDCHAR